MANHKVRAGAKYIFYPVLMDRLHPPYDVLPGDVVEVVNLPGCPRANTMGHAHVKRNGIFAGLVHTNSLYSFADKQLVIDALKRDVEKLETR